MDFKLRALLNARRKRRRQEQKAKKAQFHLVRAQLEIRRGSVFGEEQDHFDGFMLLNDFAPRSLSFFSPVRLEFREIVALTVKLHKSVFVRGKVLACNEMPLTEKVFLQESHRFRVQIQLEFTGELEKKSVEKLSHAIQAQWILDRT